MRNIALKYRNPLVDFNVAMLLNSKADGVLANDRAPRFASRRRNETLYVAEGAGDVVHHRGLDERVKWSGA